MGLEFTSSAGGFGWAWSEMWLVLKHWRWSSSSCRFAGRKRGFLLLRYILSCWYSYSCSYCVVTYYNKVSHASPKVSVCAVFLTTVIVSLTSPSVMGLPRIVARAFPTDCKRQSNRLHLRSRTASEAAGQLHAIVRHPAVPQYLHGSKRRHIRQSLYSSKRSHQDQQHPLGYSGQHGFRAHLRSWLPRARGHAHPAHQGQCFADLWTENCRNE
jgi:hypothetical protein